MIGEDGFTYYTCTGECGQTKIAALFLPSELAKDEPVCRVCIGEITINSGRPRNPKLATAARFKSELERRVDGPRFASQPVHPHYVRSVPARFSRGGAVR